MQQQRDRRQREATKQQRIVAVIRGQIVEGKYPPGAQLPLRRQMCKRFGVSQATVQWALDRLKADGFVEARSRQGTRVVAHPPHLNQYGLVFSGTATGGGALSRFWAALTDQALTMSAASPRRFEFYQGLDGRLDSELCSRLEADMTRQRVAGVVFVLINHPELAGTAILEESEVPRVAITHRPELWSIPTIKADTHSFIDKALDYLASKGRRRVALLVVTGADPADLEYYHRAAADRDISTPPCWVQSVGYPEMHWASNCVQAMMRGPANDRPDGLIIYDDNLVEHSAAGLVAMNVRVPRDLEVVAHCNFARPVSSVLPFRKLGFDTGAFLRAATHMIDRQRAGQRFAARVSVPAVFEDEL